MCYYAKRKIATRHLINLGLLYDFINICTVYMCASSLVVFVATLRLRKYSEWPSDASRHEAAWLSRGSCFRVLLRPTRKCRRIAETSASHHFHVLCNGALITMRHFNLFHVFIVPHPPHAAYRPANNSNKLAHCLSIQLSPGILIHILSPCINQISSKSNST